MAEKKKFKKFPEITSPVGTFKFPSLTEPFYGTDDFKIPDGKYGVRLILQADDPATVAFLGELEPHYKEALANGAESFKELKVATRKKLGKVTEQELFSTVYDQETEEPTGEIEFRSDMKASGVYKSGRREGEKWERKPLIFDASGARMKQPPLIWGGTTGRVRMALNPYFIPGTGLAGLKLMLVGVQIIELVTPGDRSADSMGFGSQEGYVAETEPSFPTEPDNDNSDDDDEAGDF